MNAKTDSSPWPTVDQQSFESLMIWAHSSPNGQPAGGKAHGKEMRRCLEIAAKRSHGSDRGYSLRLSDLKEGRKASWKNAQGYVHSANWVFRLNYHREGRWPAFVWTPTERNGSDKEYLLIWLGDGRTRAPRKLEARATAAVGPGHPGRR